MERWWRNVQHLKLHMQGKHDQQAHASGGRRVGVAGSSSGDYVPTQREIEEYRRDMSKARRKSRLKVAAKTAGALAVGAGAFGTAAYLAKRKRGKSGVASLKRDAAKAQIRVGSKKRYKQNFKWWRPDQMN